MNRTPKHNIQISFYQNHQITVTTRNHSFVVGDFEAKPTNVSLESCVGGGVGRSNKSSTVHDPRIVTSGLNKVPGW